MSQSVVRGRKAAMNSEVRSRSRLGRASGDAQRPERERSKSKHKERIPKNMRYDLENALLSLCDVWFEDIKPYLVRNNIKLHVHGGTAAGDHERRCAHQHPGAGSDHPQRPAANSAGCCATRQTALRPQCRRPQPTSMPLLSPRSRCRPARQTNPPNQAPPRPRRTPRRPRAPSAQSWQVPRLCRTYSLITEKNQTKTGTRKARTAKNTADVKIVQTTPKPKPETKCVWTQTTFQFKPTTVARRSEFGPCPGNTKIQRREPMVKARENTLFSEDLIDIIAKKHNKSSLVSLFRSPDRGEKVSSINLFVAPEPRKSAKRRMVLPWR